jgi:hypothetical protein
MTLSKYFNGFNILFNYAINFQQKIQRNRQHSKSVPTSQKLFPLFYIKQVEEYLRNIFPP